MKVTVYMRVGVGPRGPKVAASITPNYEPLKVGSGWQARIVPTAMFALKLDVPDEVLHHAEQIVNELTIETAEPAVGVEES